MNTLGPIFPSPVTVLTLGISLSMQKGLSLSVSGVGLGTHHLPFVSWFGCGQTMKWQKIYKIWSSLTFTTHSGKFVVEEKYYTISRYYWLLIFIKEFNWLFFYSNHIFLSTTLKSNISFKEIKYSIIWINDLCIEMCLWWLGILFPVGVWIFFGKPRGRGVPGPSL